jgi:FMN-dependent NADH-azoreductase
MTLIEKNYKLAQLTQQLSEEETEILNRLKNTKPPVVKCTQNFLKAGDIVSVQPMSLPSGLIFYTNYVYGDIRLFQLHENGALVFCRNIPPSEEFLVIEEEKHINSEGIIYQKILTQFGLFYAHEEYIREILKEKKESENK